MRPEDKNGEDRAEGARGKLASLDPRFVISLGIACCAITLVIVLAIAATS